MPKTGRPITSAAIAKALPKEQLTDTLYGHDSRVEQDNSGGVYVTNARNVRYHVINSGSFGWSVLDPTGDAAPGSRPGTRAVGFAHADNAIFFVIGRAEDRS